MSTYSARSPLLINDDLLLPAAAEMRPRRSTGGGGRRGTHNSLDDTHTFGAVEAFRERAATIDKRITDLKRNASSEPELREAVKDDREIDIREHMLSSDECAAAFNVELSTGLSSHEAAQRLSLHGRNELTPPYKRHWIWSMIGHLFEQFALLLWLGSFLCFVAYALDEHKGEDNLILGITLAVVVTMSGLFSFYQDHKSEAIMEGFKNFLPSSCQVLRDGRPQQILSAEVVPGDILQVKIGEKMPADIRIVDSQRLKVDNSSLTGEPDALLRVSNVSSELNPLESHNLAFFGTMAVEGRATGIVIRTGDRTVIGSIAQLASKQSEVPTPLAIEISYFIKIITAVALFLGITFGAYGLIKADRPPITNIVFGIGIIVANVPEGLLATVTVALTLTARAMASRSILVKALESVETLGSTTCIASDKTGTLTQNLMSVAHLYYDGNVVLPQAQRSPNDPTFRALHEIGVLCNKAIFVGDDIDGDAGEKAFVRYFHAISDINQMRNQNRELTGIPFNSAIKYQLSIHLRNNDYKQDRLLALKGAPERVLDRCSHIMDRGTSRPLTDQDTANIQEALSSLMGNGERILGLCSRLLPASEYPKDFEWCVDLDVGLNFPTDGFTFVGLISLMDPPREAVPEAVLLCQSAGIKVIMVTGDHPDTAEAIARKVNIITGMTRKDLAKQQGVKEEHIDMFDHRIVARVITGMELADMTDEQLSAALDFKEVVFARTSPAQKLFIVEGLQNKTEIRRVYNKQGEFMKNAPPTICKNIVAVTGDGVNDSPALKQANIGVAMGIAGSDVAKEAANMILLNDDFSSIVLGVEEGRKIFDNLKKSIAYTLTSNVPEIGPFLLFMVFGLPLAMETILILCIDLGTDMLPAIALAYEHKEADIMKNPPRDSNTDRLVTKQLIFFSYPVVGLWQAVTAFIIFFGTLEGYGFPTGMLWGIGNNFVSKNINYNNATGEAESMTIPYASGKTITWPLLPCTLGGDEPDGISLTGPCHNAEEALKYAQTCYFVNIIICQIFTGLACKTRLLSLFSHGMRNTFLNFGILSEVLLTLVLCYLPGVHAIGTRPIAMKSWLNSAPFGVCILIWDEIRKFILRRDETKKSLFYKIFYY